MSAQTCIRTLSRMSTESIRLVCFPHAGAGASIYHAWTSMLPSCVGIYGVQLAGREQRAAEPFVVHWTDLVAEISDALAGWDDKPYAFYGHSLGGLIAYEVAAALQRRGGAMPRILVAGGAYAPSAVCKAHTQFEDEKTLLHVVRRLGGVADELMADADFARYFLPVIAADFTLFNRYTYDPSHGALECDVAALHGTDDVDHGRVSTLRWREHAGRGFCLDEVPGGHFFHRERASETVGLVLRRLGERGLI
ncbi:thioesterase II family protein [Paraburkholderia caledonica]|uniref:Surfactin synthase thioesterase subunit n=1 Tax=Paraburkholderia caledonica TaxID=134536 RepID=A0AB73INH8_9BURK|nr:surfactin synthase thioesterase subunit [Paraburkholderia caledonica]